MRYDITKQSAPQMPTLGKGAECIKILLSQTSKDMHEPLVPMLFPVFGAHVSGSEFQYPDLSWKDFCGQMGNLMLKNEGVLHQIPPKHLQSTKTALRQHQTFIAGQYKISVLVIRIWKQKDLFYWWRPY